jgi:hypothetical protein
MKLFQHSATNEKNLFGLTHRRLVIVLYAILATALTAGCSSLVAKSGDAKIVTRWQLMREKGMEMYYMELPAINLSVPGTIILRVRNLPTYLEGQFLYFLSMEVPDSETFPSAQPPWKDAKITLVLRHLDGSEAFKQIIPIGISRDRYGTRSPGWNVDWGLGLNDPAPMMDSSYDIVIVVDHPSLRQTDHVSLDGYAYIHKP